MSGADLPPLPPHSRLDAPQQPQRRACGARHDDEFLPPWPTITSRPTPSDHPPTTCFSACPAPPSPLPILALTSSSSCRPARRSACDAVGLWAAKSRPKAASRPAMRGEGCGGDCTTVAAATAARANANAAARAPPSPPGLGAGGGGGLLLPPLRHTLPRVQRYPAGVVWDWGTGRKRMVAVVMNFSESCDFFFNN